MVKNLLTLGLFAAVLSAPFSASAQEKLVPVCGASEAMEEHARLNPAYAQQLAEQDLRIRSVSENNNLRGMQQTVKVIPVVVHIMHDYGGSNITRDQVLDALRVLNDDFNKTNSDTAQVISAFQSLYANAQIEFRLAQIDPSGNCTEGITRTYTPLTNTADNAVKDLIRWNPSKYLNVWVVNTIASGAGGYSYRPCVSSSIDGIVVRNAQFGSIGTSSGNGLSARTLTHEVGHYLGLPHTWGGSNTPGLATNCDIDDGITDTPNTVGVSNQSCNTNANSCGTLNNVQNFMDYANCPKMFTLGQKAVMHDALNLACRVTLWSQTNLVATGTNDGFSAVVCAPQVDFNTSRNRFCEGTTVMFNDLSYNASPDSVWSYLWTFPGGVPSTSTDKNPTVQYPTAGVYSVTLEATTSGGTTTRTKTDYINVMPINTGVVAPMNESFEATAFPISDNGPLQNWEEENTTTNNWERTTLAAHHGSASARIRNSVIPVDRSNALISPNINLTNVVQPTVRFAYAYALTSAAGGNQDRLRIFYSVDCGQTWTLRFAKAGSSLATTSPVSGNFVPQAGDWKEESFSLPQSAQHAMLKFESTSGNESILYLDYVRVEGLVSATPDANTHQSLSVYPNPNNGQAIISYELLQAGETQLSITNTIGQEVFRSLKAEQAGKYEYQLQQLGTQLAPGVYTLRLQSAGKVSVQKIVVN